MYAARHEIVARAFRSWLGENGRLDLEKPAVAQKASRCLQQPMPQDEILLQLGTSQVQVAVTQPQLLRWKRLISDTRHGYCWRRGRTDQLERLGPHLDVAGGEIGVAHFSGSRDDLSLDEDDALRSKCGSQAHRFRGGVSRIERDLNEPASVSQIDEHQLAEVAFAMHPTAESDFGAGVGTAERTAGMSSKCRRESGRRCHQK